MGSFLFSTYKCFCDEWIRKHQLQNISNIFTRLVRIVTSYCFNCPTHCCCKCDFFLATHEDRPTHYLVLLVDTAPFFGCVIDCSALSLLHEVPVVLILVMKSFFGSILNFTCFCPTNLLFSIFSGPCNAVCVIVWLSVRFLVSIALHVHLWITTSDDPFVIFKPVYTVSGLHYLLKQRRWTLFEQFWIYSNIHAIHQ